MQRAGNILWKFQKVIATIKRVEVWLKRDNLRFFSRDNNKVSRCDQNYVSELISLSELIVLHSRQQYNIKVWQPSCSPLATIDISSNQSHFEFHFASPNTRDTFDISSNQWHFACSPLATIRLLKQPVTFRVFSSRNYSFIEATSDISSIISRHPIHVTHYILLLLTSQRNYQTLRAH